MSTFNQLLIGVGVTTLAWIGVTLVTSPEEEATLIKFYEKIQPGGPGWKKVVAKMPVQNNSTQPEAAWDVPLGIVCMIMGTAAVYSLLLPWDRCFMVIIPVWLGCLELHYCPCGDSFTFGDR